MDNYTLHNGKWDMFINAVPTDNVNLIISSPPYNIGKSYESKKTILEYLSEFKPLIKELHRVLTDSGSVCWQVGNFVENGEVFPLDILFYDLFKQIGFKLRNRIIWHFGHGLHAKKRLSGRYETILWFTKSDSYVFNLDEIRVPSKYPDKKHYKGDKKGALSGNPLGKNPSDVWEVLNDDWDSLVWEIPNVKSNHPEKTVHPCQFPVELAERCVLALTNENHVVFDPFAGVGSSLLAALLHNRKALGFEKEKEYVDISNQRAQDYKDKKLKVRPLGKPIYSPKG